jgi:hypothetical protein
MDAAEKAEIDTHLDSCTLCRIHLADMKTTLLLIKSTPEVEPPVWMKSRIMARLREEQATTRSWFQRIWFPLHTGLSVKALALLVVCVSGYYLSRSVDSELKLAEQQKRQELPAQPVPALAPPPALDPVRVLAPKKAESTPQLQTQRKELAQTIQPSTAPAYAPPPHSAMQEAVQAPHAPSPAAKGIASGKAEIMKAAPASEVTNRLQDQAPEAKSKSRRSLESSLDNAFSAAERSAAAPAGAALPRQIIRITLHNPEQATSLIRETVSRSGGSIIDDQITSQQRCTIRLPADRQKELLERLKTVGRITERPATPPPGTALVEITIQW